MHPQPLIGGCNLHSTPIPAECIDKRTTVRLHWRVRAVEDGLTRRFQNGCNRFTSTHQHPVSGLQR